MGCKLKNLITAQSFAMQKVGLQVQNVQDGSYL